MNRKNTEVIANEKNKSIGQEIYLCNELWHIILNYMPVIKIERSLLLAKYTIRTPSKFLIYCRFDISQGSYDIFYICLCDFYNHVDSFIKKIIGLLSHSSIEVRDGVFMQWADDLNIVNLLSLQTISKCCKIYYPQIVFLFNLISKLGKLIKVKCLKKYYYKR